MAWDTWIGRVFVMNDEVWQRHANPWSGWTRFATTPILFLALWSHVWIGSWALAPTAIVAAWLWLNPRLFPPPLTHDSWMTRGVLGERLWLERRTRALPAHHGATVPWIQAAAGAFLAVSLYGLVIEDFWAALLGWHGAALAKLWFVDRRVWLWDEVGPGGTGTSVASDR